MASQYSRPYSALSSQNEFGLRQIIGGYDDPSIIPTSGGIGQLYIQVSSDPLNPQYGVFQKVLTSGIDTNWEKLNNPKDLNTKDAVQVASTANVALAGVFPLNIDGVAITAAEAIPNNPQPYRILLKNQANPAENGIYNPVDAGGGNYTLVRTLDANNSSEVTQGLFTWAVLGTVNAETGWLLTTPNPITVDVTPLTFVQTPIAASTILANTIFVAKNGNDASGDGTIGRPYLTVQKGIDSAYALQSLAPVTRPVVMVAPGTYVENCTLKANVFVRGFGWNSTRITGTWTIDGSFTPPGDWRSGWADVGLFTPGTITFDFNALSSNEGKIYAWNVRFGGAITMTAFSSINQFLAFGCEYFGTLTLNGMNTYLINCISQGASIVGNYKSGSANALTISGGSHFNLTVNGVAGQFEAFLYDNVQDTAALTLNGLNAFVTACSSAIPIKSLVTFAGGATASQLARINDAYGVGFTPSVPGNWTPVPNNVHDALDQLAAAVPSGTNVVFAEVKTLNGLDIAAKKVQLLNIPSNPLQVSVQIYGGVTQIQPTDFIMTGANLDFIDWNGGLGMDSLGLVAGDKIIASYTY